MMLEASQFPKLERIMIFSPGARNPKVILEWFAKQNESLNVSSWKLTSSKEVKTKNGEVETSLQIMVEATELKAMEDPVCPWRPFCDLKRAQCVYRSQGGGDKMNQKSMKTEEKSGDEEVVSSSYK